MRDAILLYVLIACKFGNNQSMAEKDDELELGVGCCLVEYDTCFSDC